MSDFGEQPPRERRSRWTREDQAAAGQRNTDQLNALDTDWSNQEPYNPGWRRERTTQRTARRAPRTLAANLPGSLEDVPVWLQQGGWRYMAAAATFVIVLLIALLWMGNGNSERDSSVTQPQPAEAGRTVEGAEPAAQPAPEPTESPPSPEPTTAQTFVVVNTNGLGLFLRSDHNSDGTIVLETLPDGTIVEQVGEDFVGPDRVWRQVRTPSGQEGWVAVDWLQPAP